MCLVGHGRVENRDNIEGMELGSGFIIRGCGPLPEEDVGGERTQRREHCWAADVPPGKTLPVPSSERVFSILVAPPIEGPVVRNLYLPAPLRREAGFQEPVLRFLAQPGGVAAAVAFMSGASAIMRASFPVSEKHSIRVEGATMELEHVR